MLCRNAYKNNQVNTKDDELAQMATDYTPAEIAFFRAIVQMFFILIMLSILTSFQVEQIILARNESFSLSSLAALREVSAIKPKSNMSKTQAETVLASFVAKGWLLRSKSVISVLCILYMRLTPA
jgi:non-structural maintenance of chromosomes element 1